MDLVRAAEGASRVVVGTVRGPKALDVSGYAAGFEVERVLAGAGGPGEVLRLGWEELARSRPPRFADGTRAVIALAPLPPSSLWRQRFPEGGFSIAADGNGFLRDPDPATLELLEGWARLDGAAREGSAGTSALAGLVAGAAPPVAAGALRRMNEIPGLEVRLSSEGAGKLAAALEDPARPDALRRGILALAGTRRLQGLRPTVEKRASRGDPLEAPALDALRGLAGALPQERVRALLGRPEPEVRAAGARGAQGGTLDGLVPLVTGDPAPEVRVAAVEVLLAERGQGAFESTSVALFDPDLTVRAGAAKALAALGPDAVPGLEALLRGRTMPAVGPVLGALVLSGDEGRAVVKRVAQGHEDPAVRAAAGLALGRPPSEH